MSCSFIPAKGTTQLISLSCTAEIVDRFPHYWAMRALVAQRPNLFPPYVANPVTTFKVNRKGAKANPVGASNQSDNEGSLPEPSALGQGAPGINGPDIPVDVDERAKSRDDRLSADTPSVAGIDSDAASSPPKPKEATTSIDRNKGRNAVARKYSKGSGGIRGRKGRQFNSSSSPFSSVKSSPPKGCKGTEGKASNGGRGAAVAIEKLVGAQKAKYRASGLVAQSREDTKQVKMKARTQLKLAKISSGNLDKEILLAKLKLAIAKEKNGRGSVDGSERKSWQILWLIATG